MLAWLVEEVGSPYGTVATLHWAVPDAPDNDDDDGHNTTALQVELESAEDQLGAVLWNSNAAALAYLHTHVFGLSLPTGGGPASEVVPSSAPPPPLEGKNVVELGAGVGCLGIALAMAGAQVAVTDMKELLPLMAHNVQRNAQRVRARSHGIGHCVALQWKWGPTATTSVHKQLQKAMKAQPRVDPTNCAKNKTKGREGKGSGPSVEAVVNRVLSSMVESLEKSSDSLEECSNTLKAVSTSAAKSGSSTLPYHYVVMCDALYGNPKDWPALLYTLTELLSTNPAGCEIVNFCEQRVNDVEGAFLKMLDEENNRVYVPASQRDAVDDPLWTAVKQCALTCCDTVATAEKKGGSSSSGAASSSPAAVELLKVREEAASALLNYVLVQRRRTFKWLYSTEVVAEAQSELNMTIRATRIRWSNVEESAAAESSRRRARDGETDAHHHRATTASKKRKHS